MSASPSLAHFVKGVSKKVPHPTKPGLTLWDAHYDQGVLYGDKLDEEVLAMYEEELQASDSLGVSPLGSGSDYTVFLQRIGVGVLQARYMRSYSLFLSGCMFKWRFWFYFT